MAVVICNLVVDAILLLFTDVDTSCTGVRELAANRSNLREPRRAGSTHKRAHGILTLSHLVTASIGHSLAFIYIFTNLQEYCVYVTKTTNNSQVAFMEC